MPLLDDDGLIENAAVCAQFQPLSIGDENEDESLRECIKINVCKPLRDRIEHLEVVVRQALTDRGNQPRVSDKTIQKMNDLVSDV